MNNQTYFSLMPKLLIGIQEAIPIMAFAIRSPESRWVEVPVDVDGVIDIMVCDTQTRSLWIEVFVSKEHQTKDLDLPILTGHFEKVKIQLPYFLLTNYQSEMSRN